ncbi:MAG: class I SAM-dependent methyltransferase [Acidobacteria bacterium]|jgi:ubiquinone/menaquinone biosynthesis C-methylase UbiE|nr:class I SAM-dependent methyltransferase [Acidobacteriota bacterium]
MSERPRGAGKNSFSLIDGGRLFAELHLERGGVLLDLACGPGAYSLEAARRFPAGLLVRAFDLAPDLVDQLRQQAAEEGLANITAAVADIGRHLPLTDASGDFCLLAMVLHDLAADNAEATALREVRRVLRPGGVLAAVEFKKLPPPPGPPLDVRLAPAELETLLAGHGFRLEKTVDAGASAYFSIFRPGGA